MTTIRTRNLTFAWPGGRKAAGFAVGPVDLDLPLGQRTAVVGPSGSGKSTMLRLLAGLERPGGGSIEIDGRVVAGDEWVPPGQRGIGFVFQDGSLWPHMDARGHLRFANPQLDRPACDHLLAEVGLLHRAGHKPAQMSGGEQRRLGLARALAVQPQVLLLDEPLSSVDPDRRDGLALLVRRVAEQRGIALVLVTHDRDEALAIADHIVAFRDGQVVEEGPAAQLLAAPRTAWTAVFLGHASCFAAEPMDPADGKQMVQTPFGVLPLPTERNAAAGLSLVVLPGDAVVAANGDGADGVVLRSEPLGGSWQVVAEVAGRTVRAAADAPLDPGSAVHLTLRNPRFLPDDAALGDPSGAASVPGGSPNP